MKKKVICIFLILAVVVIALVGIIRNNYSFDYEVSKYYNNLEFNYSKYVGSNISSYNVYVLLNKISQLNYSGTYKVTITNSLEKANIENTSGIYSIRNSAFEIVIDSNYEYNVSFEQDKDNIICKIEGHKLDNKDYNSLKSFIESYSFNKDIIRNLDYAWNYEYNIMSNYKVVELLNSIKKSNLNNLNHQIKVSVSSPQKSASIDYTNSDSVIFEISNIIENEEKKVIGDGGYNSSINEILYRTLYTYDDEGFIDSIKLIGYSNNTVVGGYIGDYMEMKFFNQRMTQYEGKDKYGIAIRQLLETNLYDSEHKISVYINGLEDDDNFAKTQFDLTSENKEIIDEWASKIQKSSGYRYSVLLGYDTFGYVNRIVILAQKV